MPQAPNSNNHVFIMAGGSGTRFWPLSTPQRPKQFLDLTGQGTMLQLTLRRVLKFVPPDHVWVLTQEKYRDLVQDQCPEIDPTKIIGEPMMRDTSAAIALGAGLMKERYSEGTMIVLPADHIIQDEAGFAETMLKGVTLAEDNHFVTIGIQPTYPAETFGYLHKGEALQQAKSYTLQKFVEKPSRDIAESYVSSGEYSWNAGMFIWKVDLFLKALDQHLPEHAAMAQKLGQLPLDEQWAQIASDTFEPLEKVSIDFGLMEKLEQISMVEAQFDWNDVGGWLALPELIEPDESGNTLVGKLHIEKNNNCIILREEGAPPVLAMGTDELVIVSSQSGTLVCHRHEVERIKEHVKKILAT